SGVRRRAADAGRGGRAARAALHARRPAGRAGAGPPDRAASGPAVHARSAALRARRTDARSGGLGLVSDAPAGMHARLAARRSIDVWAGAEPTFTRADSPAAAWNCAAEGDDKRARAHQLAVELAAQLAGAQVTRVVGRQFPDEPHPRFAFGVRWPRAGHA